MVNSRTVVKIIDNAGNNEKEVGWCVHRVCVDVYSLVVYRLFQTIP